MGWVLCVGGAQSLFDDVAEVLVQADIATHCIPSASAASVKSLMERLGSRPGVAIIDQRTMSDEDLSLGYEIKNGASEPIPYIVTLLAADASGADRIHAYDCGADIIFRGAVDADELVTAIQQIFSRRRYMHELESQLGLARRTAFSAMTTSSRIGQIVRFMQLALEASSGDAVADCFYEIMQALDLRGMLFINGADGHKYYGGVSADMANDEVMLRQADTSRRLIEDASTLIVHDQHCALIVTNFDCFDDHNRGQLRDDLCILIEAIEARVCGLLLEKEGRHRRSLVDISVRVLSRILDETDIFNRQFTDDSSNIISAMLNDINVEFSSIDLKEEEEQRLISIVDGSSRNLHELFESKRKRDDILREILEKLFATLSS